jgi:hypothetical protein
MGLTGRRHPLVPLRAECGRHWVVVVVASPPASFGVPKYSSVEETLRVPAAGKSIVAPGILMVCSVCPLSKLDVQLPLQESRLSVDAEEKKKV